MLLVRPAEPTDAGAIAALIRDLGPSFLNPGEQDLAWAFWASVSEDAERDYIQDPDRLLMVATVEEDLAGVIAIKNNDHVFQFFVDNRFQQQGLGRRLWMAALTRINAAHSGSVITVNALLGARDFYRRLGFVETAAPLSRHGITTVPMSFTPAGTVPGSMPPLT
jgi:predicted GNAT family N-acyltransferase